MYAVLRDLFGMHDVREDNYEPQPGVQCGDNEPDRGDAQKYDDLL